MTILSHKKNLLIYSALSFTILFFFFWRFRLGLHRYFDMDEFAHLHWGYDLFAGLTPYKDFFYFIPPFFLYPIAFIFFLFGRSVMAILQARILMFFVFLGICLVSFLLFKKARNAKIALLSILVMSFLPIPFDKTIEIRPDNIAILFSLIGMYLFILKWSKNARRNLFWSGLFYGISLGFVPKTIFFLAVPLIVLAYKFIKDARIITFPKNCLQAFKINLQDFLIGLSIPGILVVILLILSGKPSLALLNIFKVSTSTTAVLGAKFYMRPDIFFYPNDTYYGFGGYNLGFWLNLSIYILGSFWAILKTVSIFSHKESERRIQEFLLGASFFLNLYAFVYIYPLKHAQYLLLTLPFLSFYFADMFENLSTRLINSVKLRNVIFLFFIFIVFVSGRKMMLQKAKWSNQKTFERVDYFLKIIPSTEKIFDLTGETIFFPDGYYFCCLPYGQYEEGIPYQLPNLEKALRDNKVKYVFIQDEGRLSVIPPFQSKIVNSFYVKDKFGLLISGVNVSFEYPQALKNINLIASGNYQLFWNGKSIDENLLSLFEVDGVKAGKNIIFLEAGKHTARALEKGELILKYTDD